MIPPSLAYAAHRATLDAMTRAVERAGVAPDRLATAASVEVGETPRETIHARNGLELVRYDPLTDYRHPVPILLVYALINRPYVLDLQPDRSIVRRLLEAGLDVYLIDWGDPSLLDASLSIHDYVNRFLDDCVDVVCDRTGADALNLLGYCMGGTLSAVYAALHPTKVNALGLLAAPLDVDDTGGVLERWGDEAHFDPRTVSETFGTVPGEFLAAGFDLMDPVANAVTKYAVLSDNLENEDFVENFARMERWLHDPVDVAGQTYAEFVEWIYQENRLARGDLVIDGERVAPEAIDAPLLQIVGEHDRLVPPTASEPFSDLVGSDDVTTVSYPSGHVGLAMATGAHRDLWPEVAEWFLEQSDRPTLADVLGEGVEAALGVDVETDVTVGDGDEMAVAIADASGDLARAVIPRDAEAVETFLEEALGVEVGVTVGRRGVAVEVVTDDGVVTTLVESLGAATRTEVREAVGRRDLAATYDLDDVRGIGPTYAGRLHAAGIDSVADLVVADPERIAAAAAASEALVDRWIDRARDLLGPRTGGT